jgi:hypothetical protein
LPNEANLHGFDLELLCLRVRSVVRIELPPGKKTHVTNSFNDNLLRREDTQPISLDSPVNFPIWLRVELVKGKGEWAHGGG